MDGPGGAALASAASLLDGAHRPRPGEAPPLRDGYLDLLGPEEPASTGATQDFMLSRAVPAIYERYWRPALGRVLKGALGPGMAEEHRIARLLLGLGAGDGVLDVACGPGNFTRGFGARVGADGLAVGVDASRTMLERAVRDTAASAGNVVFVRGDAVALPFRDAAFDAVCCFAALHLFADPWTALDHMTRVLRPGGRIAFLVSCRTRSSAFRTWDSVLGARAGIRMFERDELTGALEERGYREVTQRVSGLAQFVGARRG